MTLHHRPRCTLLAGALVMSLVTACGPVLGSSAPTSDGQGGPGDLVPAAGDVTPLADPRGWNGSIDLDLPDRPVDPVADDPQPQLPTTVTDQQDTKVKVTDTSRILALDIYGTLSRTVYELGLGEQLVGRDSSSGFPEIADLPLVTQNGHELNAEAILKLDPTVVLTDTSLGPFNVVLQLREAGVPVVVVDSERSLDNVGPLTREVADALGVSQAGQKLSKRLDREIGDVRAQVKQLTPDDLSTRMRAVFLYARGQAGVYYLFGQGSGADTLISASGGYDVAEEIGWKGMKPVNDEGLLAAQPDVVVMMSDGLTSVGGVDGLLDRFPALASTPAGEHRRIVAMDDTQILSFGPSTAAVLNALAVALYAPDQLPEAEVKAS